MIDNLPNLHEYNELVFEPNFVNTDLYKSLNKDFDRLVFTKNYDSNFPDNVTPRQFLGERTHYVRPYYYIQKLIENNPKEIFDIGCGWNIFKKYIPNITGYDINMDHADKHMNTLYDLSEYNEACDAAMSINTMHFCSLFDMEKNIRKFASIIKPNGRGYLALNIMRMIGKTNKYFLPQLFSTPEPTIEQYDEYVRKVLKKLDFNYLIVDVDLSCLDEYLNGNISIVFDKS